ncbi:MAG TPA: ATP-dependent DNA ligase [Verrucomicrobiae bacterium]|nr:ATP-dependent DNA ligase [Verrucomicrobiae bacterium]
MSLPIKPPFPPMDALSVDKIPQGEGWQYEPKWDGFRCLVFRDGDKVELQSKAGQPLARYFPEMVEAVKELPAKQFVLDGELVIPEEQALSFDELLLRLHPAESRVRKLSAAHPALLIVFDLLVDGPKSKLIDAPLSERRSALEKFAKANFGKAKRIRLSPVTRDFKEAQGWFSTPGESLDGVIAKRVDFTYRSGERDGMVKVKPIRTVECLVGGFRYGEKTEVVGSLLLGLYDEAGLLNHVGFTSSIKKEDRPALTKKLEQLKGEGFTGRAPGGPSRWSNERSAEWVRLKPELVVEVSYDHFTGGRFRHGTKFLRWRPDKAPRQCSMEQVAPKKQQKALELLGLK